MKKILSIFILSVIILSLGSTGCGSGVTIVSKPDVITVYTIKVTGTDGIPFKGNYWVDESAQGILVKMIKSGKFMPISGTTPAEYTISGGFVSCYFETDTESGTLKVQILEGDKVVTESETTVPQWWVSAGTSDNQYDYMTIARGGALTVYTIKVTGTDGLPFQGNYSNVTAVSSDVKQSMNTVSVNEQVSGTIPAQYTLPGGVTGYFRKNTDSESGTLKVQILKSGEVISEAYTTVPQGWVALGGD